MFSQISNAFLNYIKGFGSTPVANIIKSWENKPIASCVLGISQKETNSNIINNISLHASLLLMNKEIDYEIDDSVLQKEVGIVIEYGNYNKNSSDQDKDNIMKGLVIYRYGDEGGLRYYVKKYGEYIKELGNSGYIDLNIEQDNQQTFFMFIQKFVKPENTKSIKSNYYKSLNNYNNHTFIIEALKELKPYFNLGNVYPSDSTMAKKKSKKKLDFIPSDIKTELENYFKKY